MTAWNRFWLYSQFGMIVVTVLSAVGGIILINSAGQLENSIAVSVNSYFLLPGITLSLIANQVLLLTRKPRIVSTAERWLLGLEYAVIVLLVAGSLSWIMTYFEIAAAICLVPLAIVLLVLIVSGNSGKQKPANTEVPVATFAPPAAGDRIA